MNVAINLVGIPLISWSILSLLHDSDARHEEEFSSEAGKANTKPASHTRYPLIHLALNISLFPLLFFFSALYYTDVISSFSVLASYYAHLRLSRERSQGNAALRLFWFLAITSSSLLSLTFRQTNIFWVAGFVGGLELVEVLRACGPTQEGEIYLRNQPSFFEVCRMSWSTSQLYDPPAADASIEGTYEQLHTNPCASDHVLTLEPDHVKLVISLAAAALANLKTVCLAMLPYLTIVFVFAGFVVWNGGVVLGKHTALVWSAYLVLIISGDKSNHVATIHAPQMLYIWPYIVFFSWPLLHRQALEAASYWRSLLSNRESVLKMIFWSRGTLTAILVIPLMVLAVHWNTIVHPFILADNRHYVFYVFRWFLLRFWFAKYLAVPAYFICGRAVLAALGGPQRRYQGVPNGSPNERQEAQRQPSRETAQKQSERESRSSKPSVRASFVLIWLIISALSVITAPLVEPRYFMIPWLIWRLHLPVSQSAPLPESPSSTIPPSTRDTERPTTTNRQHPQSVSRLFQIYRQQQHRLDLWLETAWFLVVNLATCYVFLHRGFSWPQEPGRVQRFMW